MLSEIFDTPPSKLTRIQKFLLLCNSFNLKKYLIKWNILEVGLEAVR
jgi:hypothetical protein